MPECGEGFFKILLALWATWFIILSQRCPCDIRVEEAEIMALDV
jgi:hypothetical protein